MNEIIKGMSESTYSSRTEYIRSSLLKVVLQEPPKTVKAIIDGKVTRESDAMKMGSAFHGLLLEGKKDYVVKPETYNFGKKWTRAANYCAEWEDAQALPIVSKKEADNLEGMVQAVHDHPELKPYLRGQCELSIFVDKYAKLKCRIDLLPDDPDAPVIDFKKARSAKPEDFVKDLFNRKQYLSCAMYLDILRAVGIVRREFWFVAMEDEYPFNCYIAKMVDEPLSFIEFGRKEYHRAYHSLMAMLKSNSWPTYPSSRAEDFLTPWQMQALELATA